MEHEGSLLCSQQPANSVNLYKNFVTSCFFLRGVVSPSPKPPSWGPPFVSCPWLLFQYVRSYPPNLGAVSTATQARAMPW